MPWVESCLDEYTEDNWQDVPDYYREVLESEDIAVIVREMVVLVPDAAVLALFDLPDALPVEVVTK